MFDGLLMINEYTTLLICTVIRQYVLMKLLLDAFRSF